MNWLRRLFFADAPDAASVTHGLPQEGAGHGRARSSGWRAIVAAFNMLLAALLVIAFFWYSLQRIGYHLDFAFIPRYATRYRQGFVLTVALSLASLVLSLLLGALAAWGSGARLLVLRYLCRGYVRFIRGTPLMMQIYLFFYIVGTAWGISNRFLAGVLILSVFEGAYISEILRGAYQSLDRSQLLSAEAVGFDRRQTLRHVILPQMVARTLPALTGQFASIIKDSSLLALISLIELTQTTREMTATEFNLFEAYFLLSLLYLLLTLPIDWVTRRLERRFHYEA